MRPALFMDDDLPHRPKRKRVWTRKWMVRAFRTDIGEWAHLGWNGDRLGLFVSPTSAFRFDHWLDAERIREALLRTIKTNPKALPPFSKSEVFAHRYKETVE